MTRNNIFCAEILPDVLEELFFRNARIQSDNAFFWMQSDKNALLWGDIFLSAALGIHSTYCIGENEWHDCIHQAKRKAVRVDEKTLEMRIDWNEIPFAQEWNIKKAGQNKFVIKVKNIVKEEFEVLKEHFYFMFDKRYVRWYYDKEQCGEFPSNFNEKDGNAWKLLHESDNFSKPFRVSAGDTVGLPDVSVSFKPLQRGFAHQVMNSGEEFSARLVQCGRDGAFLLHPGEYDFLKVTVEFKI